MARTLMVAHCESARPRIVSVAAAVAAIESWDPDLLSLTSLLIGGLVAGLLFVSKRWLDSRSERADLQKQVAFLKRRLAQTRR